MDETLTRGIAGFVKWWTRGGWHGLVVCEVIAVHLYAAGLTLIIYCFFHRDKVVVEKDDLNDYASPGGE